MAAETKNFYFKIPEKENKYVKIFLTHITDDQDTEKGLYMVVQTIEKIGDVEKIERDDETVTRQKNLGKFLVEKATRRSLKRTEKWTKKIDFEWIAKKWIEAKTEDIINYIEKGAGKMTEKKKIKVNSTTEGIALIEKAYAKRKEEGMSFGDYFRNVVKNIKNVEFKEDYMRAESIYAFKKNNDPRDMTDKEKMEEFVFKETNTNDPEKIYAILRQILIISGVDVVNFIKEIENRSTKILHKDVTDSALKAGIALLDRRGIIGEDPVISGNPFMTENEKEDYYASQKPMSP